jgi:hypothetical protein
VPLVQQEQAQETINKSFGWQRSFFSNALLSVWLGLYS